MDTERICQSCGKPLPGNAPQGLCPECLMKVGFGTGIAPGPGEPPQASRFIPPPVEKLAELFPQLEILELLGQGGMGAVYKARQRTLDRLVALKILPPQLGSPEFAERFTREARALGRLTHSNIVAVHDFGRAGEFPFFIMEFVDGANLREIERAGKLAPREALQIIPQLCEALQFAHDEGIVHRDIKPENILVDKKGRVKIADFGIAKILGQAGNTALTGVKDVVGTPHYMAPEQIERPLSVDHRADIYSLGVVFYEMLTGELPLGKFERPSKKVAIDVRLDEIVLHTLEKEPARRYQQANQVKTDVETVAISAGKTEAGPNVPTAHHREKESAHNPVAAFWKTGLGKGLAIGAILVLGITMAVQFASSRRAEALRQRAMAQEARLREEMRSAVEDSPLSADGSANDADSDAAALNQRAWRLWQTGQMREAGELFSKAVKLDPRKADAWNGLGWVNFNSGKPAEAERAFAQAIKVDPNHPAALNGLGQVYLTQKNYKDAERYFLKASAKAPASWYGLARLYLLQGKFEEAERWAQNLVDSGQADEVARRMLQAAKDKNLSEGLRLTIEPQ